MIMCVLPCYPVSFQMLQLLLTLNYFLVNFLVHFYLLYTKNLGCLGYGFYCVITKTFAQILQKQSL